jgi:hypothetical protein
MVLEGAVWVSHDEIRASMSGTAENWLSLHCVRTQQEGGSLPVRKKGRKPPPQTPAP